MAAEGLEETIRRTYDEAAPYLADVKWVKELLGNLTDRSRGARRLLRKLESIQRSLEEETKRTDVKIFIMYYVKHAIKKGLRA